MNLPEWTEYSKKNGLDPLGMQNSGVKLYQTFLPGISNVTLRMRYYGLYAWLCDIYGRRIGDTNPERWKRFVRRSEALYALIAHHAGGETGVAGIEWAQRTIDRSADGPIDFAAAAEPGSDEYYLKQAWGAYGAAYRSQLLEIGILTTSHDHDVPHPTEDFGEPLAAAFAAALGDLPDLYFEIVQRGTVTRDELSKLAPAAPRNIAPAGDERATYQEVLLGGSTANGATALSRRLSLMLVLKIAALLGREPSAEEVRWALYSGMDRSGRPLALGASDLEAQRERWVAYQANDLSHIACEALLKFILDQLGEFPGGTTMNRLIPLATANILEKIGEQPASWADFLKAVVPAENAYDGDDPASEFSLAQAIMKGAGRRENLCTAETAMKGLRLLATLHRRIRDSGRDLNAEFGHYDPDAFRSLLTELRFLDRHQHDPFVQTVERLIEERIVRRHLWVALKKLRHQNDYTFLIESDNGRIRLRERDGPVFTNPRLGPAIMFLKDIHLLGEHGLTDEGRALVEAA